VALPVTWTSVFISVNCFLSHRYISHASDMSDEKNLLSKLAVPGVIVLIAFLSYSSQALLLFLEPGPLTPRQLTTFNSLVACIWICYFRTCRTSPGTVPNGWHPEPDQEIVLSASQVTRQRFCRKCDSLKPPRSHHCKICKRLVFAMFALDILTRKMRPKDGPPLSVD